jgi:hypothetical protein
MDPKILMQINEIYQNEVYAEETLSEEELVSIEEWVEALIEEGYDLDQYSDEELYEAYLSDLDEGFKPTNYTHGPNIFHGRGKKAQQIDRQIEKFKKTGDVRAQQIDFVNRMMDDPEGRKDSIAKSRENRMSSTNKAREDAKRDIKKYGMKEELDLYDIVSEYLVSEGFCDSYEDADVIMANMSEEWRESVLDEVTGRGYIEPVTGRHTGSHPAVRTQKPGSPAMGLMGRNPYDKNRTKAKYVQSLPSTPENQRRLRNLNKGERVMMDRYRTTQNAAHDARHKEKYGQ